MIVPNCAIIVNSEGCWPCVKAGHSNCFYLVGKPYKYCEQNEYDDDDDEIKVGHK